MYKKSWTPDKGQFPKGARVWVNVRARRQRMEGEVKGTNHEGKRIVHVFELKHSAEFTLRNIFDAPPKA